MPHGVDLLRCLERVRSAQNTEESTSCTLSTKIEPDSRGLVPGIHVFRSCGKKDVDGRDKPGHDVERSRDLTCYSITACSGAADCLRSAALVEPIMIPSGIAHSVKIITI